MDLAATLGLGRRELCAFVGAGGKKTAMGHLLDSADDRAVGYTTTTHTPPPSGVPLVLADPDRLRAVLADAPPTVAFAAQRVANPKRVDEKVRGFDPDVVEDCFAAGRFDWLLVKADGARRRELKAPADHEPAIPATATHVVAVVSVRAVGRPLDERVVHRPERVAAVTDTELGETITAETVGRALASESGGLKGVPEGATATALVNKADTPALRETAREALAVAAEWTDGFEQRVVTSFETGFLETR